MKKLIISATAFCFVFIMFIFLVAVIGDESDSSIEKTTNNCNSSLVENFIEYATSEYETCGSVLGGDKYREWYIGRIDYEPWCATFVSYIAAKTGILYTVIPKFQSCDAGVRWFSENDQYFNTTEYGGSYDEPSTGDIVFFSQVHDRNDSTHVGIVVSYENGEVTTIEGNSGNQIKMKSYNIGSKFIIGYACPDYTSSTLIRSN